MTLGIPYHDVTQRIHRRHSRSVFIHNDLYDVAARGIVPDRTDIGSVLRDIGIGRSRERRHGLTRYGAFIIEVLREGREREVNRIQPVVILKEHIGLYREVAVLIYEGLAQRLIDLQLASVHVPAENNRRSSNNSTYSEELFCPVRSLSSYKLVI